MHYNGDKFELIRYGKTEAKPIYHTPAGTVIKQKNNIRDLGVLMSSNAKSDTHIKNSYSRTSNSRVGTNNIQNKSLTTDAYVAENSCCKSNGILQPSLESNGHYNIPRACLVNRPPIPAMDLKSNRSGL